MPRRSITRRRFLHGLATVAATAALPAALTRGTAAIGPNILLLSADGLSPNDLGCYGNPRASSSQLDALARAGMRFTAFHAASPVRDPSHFALLSGRHPRRFSAAAAMAGWHRNDPGKTGLTLPDRLRDAGYDTRQSVVDRDGRGLIQVDAASAGAVRFADPAREASLAAFNESLAHAAVAFITSHRAGRYFLDLHFAGSVMGPSDSRVRARRLESLDSTIGRVIAAASRNPAEKPMIVFAASCGPWTDEITGHPRGGRGTLWEGGHRVPAIAAWPGRIAGGREFASPASNLDLCPTILAAAGADREEAAESDGLDLLPSLKHGLELPPRTLWWSYSGSLAAREGDWKYLFNRAAGPKGGQLFHLARDPGERLDLQREHPVRAARMAHALRAWEAGLVG